MFPLNAIWNDTVPRTAELLHALNATGMRARAFNASAPLGEQSGKVGAFRLAGAVFHDGLAPGESRGHHQVFCAGDGDLVKNNVSAVEPFRAGFYLAMFLFD